MRKILLLLTLTLSLSLFLTGCGGSEDLTGNADEKTKQLLLDTIESYDLTRHIFGEGVTFELEDKKNFNGNEYSRVQGNIFENLSTYEDALQNTFTPKRAKEVLEQLNDENSIIRSFDNKLYVSDYYINLPEEIQSLRPNIDTLNLITEKDNLMVVNYKKINSGVRKKSYTDQTILLEKVGDTYLVSDNINKYSPATEEYLSLIQEHFNLSDDKSTFIATNNLYLEALSMSGKGTFLELYFLFKPEGNILALNSALMYNSKLKTVEDLKIEEDRIINKIFTDLSSDDKTKILIIPVEEDLKSASKLVKFQNYGEEEKGNYIIVPKYLDNDYIQIQPSNSNYQGLYSNFFIGLEGEYNIKYEDGKSAFEINTENLSSQTLPKEVQLLNSKDFIAYLNAIK
ncbi:hypothetical protein [Anaerosphaera multitolerans]|uniref:Lipoprotein n=1 Tax=Anaerosphaera multitolerans TaxID=2487351 RepID=A0A437S8Q9_9FIRM|nr:hypothetical protein [Anaerosphaera multitolerans]RVU55490.1 hypothetical protein EF514_01815 [Anaerosphaera multitolerans]